MKFSFLVRYLDLGDDQKCNMIEESERDVFKKFERTFTNTLGNAKSIENLEQATDTNFQIFSKPVAQLIVFFLNSVEELSIKLQIRWVTVRVSSWNFLWSHWSSFGVDVCNFFNHLKLFKWSDFFWKPYCHNSSTWTPVKLVVPKIRISNWSHDRIQNNNTFEVMKGFRMAFSFCNVLLKSRYIGDRSEQNWE